MDERNSQEENKSSEEVPVTRREFEEFRKSVTDLDLPGLRQNVETLQSDVGKLPTKEEIKNVINDAFANNNQQRANDGLGQLYSSSGDCFDLHEYRDKNRKETDPTLYLLKEGKDCKPYRPPYHAYPRQTDCHPSACSTPLSAGLLGTWFGMGNWFASPLHCTPVSTCHCAGYCNCRGTHY